MSSNAFGARCANVTLGLDGVGKQYTPDKYQAHGGHVIIDSFGKYIFYHAYVSLLQWSSHYGIALDEGFYLNHLVCCVRRRRIR